MTDLTGKLIANTYKDILTVDTSTTNSGLDNNLRKVQDGAGNSSSLKLSQTAAAFTGNVSVNGNMTVQGTFQPNTINTSQLDVVNISATNITTDTLTANNLTFQNVSVSSLRTGDLYAANISAGTISATNINTTNITVGGDGVATSSALASVEAIISSNIVFVLNAQASVLTVLAGLSATDTQLQNNINSVSTTVSAVNTQVGINSSQINTLSTSIAANASAIAVNAAAITSINSFISAGAFASAGTSATLETRIASVSSTMATSIDNSNTAITNLSATLESRIAGVSATMAASIASTSSTLESHINTVSATLSSTNVALQTSINNSNTAIAANTSLITALSSTLESRIATVSSTMATSIAAVSSTLNTRIASVSSTMATSIANVRALVTGVNASAIAVLQTSVAANSSAIAVLEAATYASVNTSATLETRIATVSSTMATSIANSNSAIAAVSSTMATSINNTNAAITSVNSRINSVSVLAETKASAATSANLETRINAVSVLTQTNKTSIAANASAIAVLQGITYASAGTSATLESRIATVSSTMATSISNSNSAIATLSATMATSIANHLRLSGGTLTGALTLNADPTLDLQAATKQYVDNLTASGIHFHESVRVENPGALTVTYNNGTAGVGATLTNAGTQAALVIDGITMVVDDRVLIYEQADATQNGVYVVTNVGSPSTNWVLTRSDDTDTAGENDSNSLDEGSYFFVEEGNTGAGESYICNTPGTITFGTTEITFVQFSSSISYTAGTGININASRVISTSGVATTTQLTTLSATLATSIANVSATLESRIATVSALIPTSLTELGITDGTAGQYLQTNANGTYSFTSVAGGGSGVSNITAGTNIALTQNGVTVTDTTTSATINVVGVASAGTSAALESRIASVSSTMATSINNSNSAITALSATMATSIANSNAAITSVNTRINSVSVLAETKASAATSANLQTRINTVSATMATSIANVSSALGSRITTLSATMATSISNKVSKSGDTMTNTLTMNTGAVPFSFREAGYTGSGEYWRHVLDGGNMRFDISTGGGASFTSYITPFQMSSSGALTSNGNKVWDAGNDGAGSGLDADTVDGLQASQFLRSDVADTAVKLTFGTGGVQAPTPSDATTGARLNLYPTGSGSDYTIGIESGAMWFNSDDNYKWYVDGSLKFEWDNSVGQFEIGGNKVWNAGNDGSGSGLDADTVDGLQASQFLRSDATDITTGYLTVDNHFRVLNSGVSGQGDNNTHFNYNNAGSNYIRGTITIVNSPIDIQGNNIAIDVNKGFNNSGAWTRNTTPSGYIEFGPANTSHGHIYTDRASFYFNKALNSTGNITAYASDERLKEKIATVENGLDKVCQLRGVTFSWKDDVEEKGFTPEIKNETGFIAQEVQKVLPEAVVPAPFDHTGNAGEGVSDSGENYLTVKPEKLIPLLVEAIKELKAEVEQLKSEK